MNLIYNEVKSGKEIHPENLYTELELMKKEGVEVFVLGCTELPLVFQTNNKYKFIDCTEVLAKAAIRESGYRLVV
jgi:aspartate racemase